MFHPERQSLERGWVGRVDDDRVVHLAAQTLQSYFLGGGGAREHADYPLDSVVLRPPVLQPPTVRVFEAQAEFAFANASAVVGPGAAVHARGSLLLLPRLAAVIGAEGAVGGLTLFGEWRDEARAVPKDRDFALAIGPYVVTPDELPATNVAPTVRVDGERAPTGPAPAFDWEEALALARDGTTLRPGDLVAGPAYGSVPVPAGAEAEISAGPLGTLDLRALTVG
jgi:Fumarylacetoacetate (FAA) hydrolase family